MSSNTVPATRVVTNECRLSYAFLAEPQESDSGKPKYSVTALIPKSDTDTLARIKAAQKAAALKGKDTKFGGKIPSNLKLTLRDGDADIDTDEHPEYAGHMFIAVRSLDQPGLFDSKGNPILDAREVYSGCYGRVSMDFYPYDNNGKGVTAGLRGVQKTRDGEPLGGGSFKASADEFGAFEGASNDADDSELDDLLQ